MTLRNCSLCWQAPRPNPRGLRLRLWRWGWLSVSAGRGKARDLPYIFVTHLHSDHIGGYFPLLEEAWLSGMNGPLDVYAPPPME